MTACQNGCVGGASVAATYLSHSFIAIVDVHYDVCVVSHNVIGTPLNLRGGGRGEGGREEEGKEKGRKDSCARSLLILMSNVQSI